MSNPVDENRAGGKPAEESADGEELARRFKGGDESAFNGLVALHQSRIFNLAYRMVNNYEDAGEVTQEIFVKVYKSIGRFRGESRFQTWLYALATNTCRNRIRRMRRLSMFEARSLDEPADENGQTRDCATEPGPDPAEVLRRSEVVKLVEKCVAGLPAEFSTVVIMRDIQGMDYNEIAEALNCSLGTVKSRLSRGRNAVKDRLKRHGLCGAEAY